MKNKGEFFNSSGKHVHVIYTPCNPLLYSKTGVCRSIPIFLIFDPKQIVGTLQTRYNALVGVHKSHARYR